MVLCRRNDRFQEKLLFYLRKTTFLGLEGTLGRPKRRLEDRRGAKKQKRPPGLKKYGFTAGIQGSFRTHQVTPTKSNAKSTLESRVRTKSEGQKLKLDL